jgi:hypothetical protein
MIFQPVQFYICIVTKVNKICQSTRKHVFCLPSNSFIFPSVFVHGKVAKCGVFFYFTLLYLFYIYNINMFTFSAVIYFIKFYAGLGQGINLSVFFYSLLLRQANTHLEMKWKLALFFFVVVVFFFVSACVIFHHCHQTLCKCVCVIFYFKYVSSAATYL